MSITDEMVEAAARAICCPNADCAQDKPRDGYVTALPCCSLLHKDSARAALEAVAPLIRAAALEEAAKTCDWHSSRVHPEGMPEEVVLSYSYASRDCATAIRHAKETDR